jgi:hypothetical protein
VWVYICTGDDFLSSVYVVSFSLIFEVNSLSWLNLVKERSFLCGDLITRPEESYRLWCLVVCDLETSWMRTPWPTGRLLRQTKERMEKSLCFCAVETEFLSIIQMILNQAHMAKWDKLLPSRHCSHTVHYSHSISGSIDFSLWFARHFEDWLTCMVFKQFVPRSKHILFQL